MASTSLQLFLGQMQSSPDALKVQLLQTTFDIFLVHQDLAKFAVRTIPIILNGPLISF